MNVVNDEGRLRHLPMNVEASRRFAKDLGYLQGNVIVLEGWRTVG